MSAVIDEATHEYLLKCGFTYREEEDKYFKEKDPEWEVERNCQKGKKQGAWPSSSVEEWKEQRDAWRKRKVALVEEAKGGKIEEDSAENLKKEEEEDEKKEVTATATAPVEAAETAERKEKKEKKEKKKRKAEAEVEDSEEVAEEPTSKKVKKEKKKKSKAEEEE